jgi:Flp pilus assembly pilin Flp
MIGIFRRLRRNAAGSTIVEFAILAPLVVTLFLGILQVGTWMQSYNALRSVAADTGRYTAVKYQRAQYIDNLAMATWARDRAIDVYLFKGPDISTNVQDAANQQIVGVTEKTLTITATYESLLAIIGIEDQTVSYSRPIFVKAT